MFFRSFHRQNSMDMCRTKTFIDTLTTSHWFRSWIIEHSYPFEKFIPSEWLRLFDATIRWSSQMRRCLPVPPAAVSWLRTLLEENKYEHYRSSIVCSIHTRTGCPEGTLMAYRGAAGGLMGLVIMPSGEIEGRFAVQIDIATILILSLSCFVHSPRTPVCSYH